MKNCENCANGTKNKEEGFFQCTLLLSSIVLTDGTVLSFCDVCPRWLKKEISVMAQVKEILSHKSKIARLEPNATILYIGKVPLRALKKELRIGDTAALMEVFGLEVVTVDDPDHLAVH